MGYYTDKKVWITGASAGIGRALANALAKEGANLILSSRKAEALERVKNECGGSNIDILVLDLEAHEDLETILQQNKNLFEDVDILINNGGISQRSKVVDTNFDVYKKLMDVNYLGTIKISQSLRPFFIRRGGGHYVVISSMAGKFGVPIRSGYSAAKMALHGFFEAFRAEVYDKNIKITMVCPGFVKTDISINSLSGDGEAHNIMDEAQEKGMNVNDLAQEILKAVEKQKEEVYFGGFKETKLAIFVSRLFPGTFRKIIRKAKVN